MRKPLQTFFHFMRKPLQQIFHIMRKPLQTFFHENWSYHLPALISLLVIVVLLFIPTGFESRLIYQGSDHTTAKVLKVYNEGIHDPGVMKVGDQGAEVEILGGKFKGQKVEAFNILQGSLDKDKIFAVGDVARVVVDYRGDKINSVNLIDYNRLPYETGFLVLFAVILLAVAGQTGFRSVLSFLLTILAIWKVLIPNVLRGANPIGLGLLLILAITVLIILPIYGLSYRSLAAILGSSLGTLATALLGIWGTRLFRIHGAVMPQAESLLYAGYDHLNLTEIFMMAIFIGASGAIMDLAVDITSAVSEVIAKKPSMGWRESYRSGMNVGRAAHPPPSLCRRLYKPHDGLYGPGNPHDERSQLQGYRRGNPPYPGRIHRSRPRRPRHRLRSLLALGQVRQARNSPRRIPAAPGEKADPRRPRV